MRVIFLLAAGAALGFAQEKSAPAKDGAIHVHGHWVLEVKNPDGSLASQHEFDNSFVGFGTIAQVLAGAFSGVATGVTAGAWVIDILVTPPTSDQSASQHAPGVTPRANRGLQAKTTQYSNAWELFVVPTVAVCGGLGNTCSTGLTVSATSNIQLVGTTVPYPDTQPGSVAAVESGLGECVNTTQPVACRAGYNQINPFTVADVTSSNMTVAPNQTITATVTISFN